METIRYKILCLVLLFFSIYLISGVAADGDVDQINSPDGSVLERNLQGEPLGMYFDGQFAGLIGKIIVKKFGGEFIERPIVANTTSKGETTYYDLKGNPLQKTKVYFKDDKNQIILSDGIVLNRNKKGERIGLYFDEKAHLTGFVAQTPKLGKPPDRLFFLEWEPSRQNFR